MAHKKSVHRDKLFPCTGSGLGKKFSAGWAATPEQKHEKNFPGSYMYKVCPSVHFYFIYLLYLLLLLLFLSPTQSLFTPTIKSGR